MPSRKGVGRSTKGDAESVPNVQAIFVSDLHLQARPPVARSAESDWFVAMARPLGEIRELKARHRCPVIYAGDIFDRWNASPEVINFAINNLTPGYAVPGQHDLPNHNYHEMYRSAYGTLVNVGVLHNLWPDEKPHTTENDLALHAFPWGTPLTPIEPNDKTNIAVVHKFVWTKDTGYTGASEAARVGAIGKKLAGFDVAVFGDNHKGFITTHNDTVICNCGGMMRRKTDEREYRPGCGLLLDDGTVARHYFDTTDDKFIQLTEAEETVEQVLDMTEFVAGLEELGSGDALDFETSMRRFLEANNIEKPVRDLILKEL